MKRITLLIALAAISLNAFSQRSFDQLKAEKAFDQKLEQGAIPSINEPEYVAYSEAEMPDNAWVLGVSDGDTARAYSLNVLNLFSVVNDELNGRKVAVIWDPIGMVGTVYAREHQGKELNFILSGALYNGSMVLADDAGGYWSSATGQGVAGSSYGQTLERLPVSTKTLYGMWKQVNPQTDVLVVQGVAYNDKNPYMGYLKAPATIAMGEKVDKALPPKVPVFGFNLDGKSYAIAQQAASNGWTGKAGKKRVLLYRPDKSHPYLGTVAYDLGTERLKNKDGLWTSKAHGVLNIMTGIYEDGTKAARLNGTDTFWYVWSSLNQDSGRTKLLNPPRRGFSEFQTETAARITSADDPTKRQ